jgi:hypothetical protein
MRDGYIVVKHAFSTQKAAEWTKGLWIRLGMDQNDSQTWTQEKVHMPHHKTELVKSFAPTVSSTNFYGVVSAFEQILGMGRNV